MTPMLREAVLLGPVHCKSNPGSCQHVPAPILAMASCCGLNQCCSKVLHRNKYITFAEFCVLSLLPIKAEESYPNMYQVGNSMTIPALEIGAGTELCSMLTNLHFQISLFIMVFSKLMHISYHWCIFCIICMNWASITFTFSFYCFTLDYIRWQILSTFFLV